MEQFSGKQYLRIDIANCYGLDGMNWQPRLQWVETHEKHLEDMADTAKYPILFRKAVRAFRTVQAGNPTNHIMGLDATASGLQIMGAMSGCHNTCRAVNLINTGNREDVYNDVSVYMSSQGSKIDRSRVKKPVMTVFYGSTAQPKAIFGESQALVLFYRALKERLTGAYELMGILQNYWNPFGEHHQWTLPDGHVARVPVINTVEKNLEIDEFDHMRFAYRAKVLGTKDTSRSLAANIVHSIDAFIVRQMSKAANQQGFWMAPIHDCFYASPNHMQNVRENYVRIMYYIAETNLVEKILSELSGRKVRYMKHSKDLPELILQSEYALS